MRASSEDVAKIIEHKNRPDGTPIDLVPFIRAASVIVDRVITCAARRKPAVTLTAEEKKLLEAWLAAHYYSALSPQMTSKGTQSSSGSFQVTPYLEYAYGLDPSGCLRSVMQGQRASAVWLGKPRSDQIAYVDRD